MHDPASESVGQMSRPPYNTAAHSEIMAKDKEMPGQPTVFTEINTNESEVDKLCK
jgi:hypothetical protein